MNPLLNERIAQFESPFRRLDALLANLAPNPKLPPIVMSVLPGAYLTQPGSDGTDDGDAYVRIALVHDPETTVAGLSRLASALGIALRDAGASM